MRKVARAFLTSGYLLCIIMVPISASMTPTVKAQTDDNDSIEEQLQQIQDLINQLNVILNDHTDNLDHLKEDMTELQANVDNMHSSYLTREMFDVRMKALDNNIDVNIGSLDKRLVQTNQISLLAIAISIGLVGVVVENMRRTRKPTNDGEG